MKKELDCHALARETGRTRASIKNIASQIPGAEKKGIKWFFPVSAIKFVMARRPGAPVGERNGRWNKNKKRVDR